MRKLKYSVGLIICFGLCLILSACSTDKAAETSSLATPVPSSQTIGAMTNGAQSLGDSQYYYTLWYQGGTHHMTIFPTIAKKNEAFKARWDNSDDFLARVGYNWGNNGKSINEIGNISAKFAFKKSERGTAGKYNYIGIYGWVRNPSSTVANEKLVEFYIVDDWFGNDIFSDKSPLGTSITQGQVIGSYVLDGASYSVIKNVRENQPSIDGTSTFVQYFAVRQKVRQSGTISISHHFEEWKKMGLPFQNPTEAAFLVEASGGKGWFDMSSLKFTKER